MATTSKTLTPTNQTITLPDMTERPDASVLVDGIGKDADAINALSDQMANKVEVAILTTTITINYADSDSIGYRTTETTKIQLSSLQGYPTGKTIVDAIVTAKSNIQGVLLWLDTNGYIRGASKTSLTNEPISISVLYK